MLLCSLSLWANETPVILVDSIMECHHPQPIHLDKHNSHRILAASNQCEIDSVVAVDQNGNIQSLTCYQYDADGHTISEVRYDWINGVKTGTSYYKKTYTGSVATTTVNYQWNAVGATWVGKDSTQLLYYENGYLLSNTKYVWNDNNWIKDQCYQYEYFKNTDIRTKSLCTKWNGMTQHEDSVDMYEWVYDDETRKLLMSAYWEFTNNQRIGKTKNVYEYNVAGKTTLEEKYKGWENGNWKGSEKNTYEYNSNGQIIEKITSKWASGWKYSKRLTQDYNTSNKLLDKANYTWEANAWKGTSRTSYEYINSNESAAIVWQWEQSSLEWRRYQRTSTQTSSGKTVQQIIQYWNGNDWINYSMTQNAYTANNLTLLKTAFWNGEEWQDSLRSEYTYLDGVLVLQVNAKYHNDQWIGIDSTKRDLTYAVIAGESKLISDSTMYWSNTSNAWTGVSKTINEYDDNGNVIRTDTYIGSGNRWINDQHTENRYKDNNGNMLIYTSTLLWDGNTQKWEAVGPKKEYEYNENGRRTGSATYRWNSSLSKWIGVSRSMEIYSGDVLEVKYIYQWLAADETWIYNTKLEYEYDSGHKIAEIKSTYDAQNTTWNYVEKERYIYSENGALTGTIVEVWNGSWCMLSQDIEYFDPQEKGGRLRYSLTEDYLNCELVSSVKHNYFYTCDNFLIQYVNYDNVILQSSEMKYGEIPTYTGVTPSKEPTAEYTYTFIGWDAEPAAVTGDATYTAVFDSTIKQYLITFMNGETVLQSTEVAYGENIIYYGEMPSRPATAQYTYTFVGWDAEPASVTGAATYNAVFDTIVNTYLITFMNGDVTLQSGQVAYGETPVYNGDAPSKDATAEYTYAFAGWDKELVAVEGDATYTATFTATKNTYTITWLNSDNSPLYQEEVAYGVTPVYTGGTPTQESTAEYTYTFVGWDSDPAPVTGAAIYKAVYSSNKNSYTVTFYLEDGITVLDSLVLEYGETPSTSLIPSKNDEEHYYYTFIGWYPEITPVTGNASYTPVYTKEPKQYTITFNNYNGRQLWTTTVPYGETPVYNGETPTRQRTQQYSYEFAGWSPELTAVSGDATYTALFDAIVNQYTVVFLNEDGTELDRQMVDYGTKPEYQGETPTKEPDAEYRYEFAGWTPRIVAVFTDATYTATYTRHDLHEGIDDVQSPCMEAQKVLINGTFYILRGDNVYTLDGVLVE